jgi:hypothetical protein
MEFRGIMYAADYLKSKGYKMFDMNDKQILESKDDAKIDSKLPRVVEGLNILRAIYGRNIPNYKEIKLEDLQRYGWYLLQRSIPPQYRIYFRGQQIEYLQWRANRPFPKNSTRVISQPNDLRIIVRVREKKFRIEGPNVGPYGYNWRYLYSRGRT